MDEEPRPLTVVVVDQDLGGWRRGGFVVVHREAVVVSGIGLLTKGSIRDIAERRQVEEAMQKAHDELELRVEERTGELSRAVNSLEAESIERQRVEEALHEADQRAIKEYESLLDRIASLAQGRTSAATWKKDLDASLAMLKPRSKAR